MESNGSAEECSARADDGTALKMGLRTLRSRREARSREYKGHERPGRSCRNSNSLRRLHFIPNLVVFVAARILLPEINVRHVLVHVVEMQRFLLLVAHKGSGLRIG